MSMSPVDVVTYTMFTIMQFSRCMRPAASEREREKASLLMRPAARTSEKKEEKKQMCINNRERELVVPYIKNMVTTYRV